MEEQENKEILAENIIFYMEKNGISKQQICKDLNFKYTTFIDWINAVTYPRMPKIEAMSIYFGCKKSDLIEKRIPAEEKIEFTPFEGKIIKAFRLSSPEEQAHVLFSLRNFFEDLEEEKK